MSKILFLALTAAALYAGVDSGVLARAGQRDAERSHLPATVVTSPGVQIRAIDGDTGKARASTPSAERAAQDDDELLLAPGEHAFRVGYALAGAHGAVYSGMDQTVRVQARAGHRYLLQVRERGNRWFASIEDVTQLQVPPAPARTIVARR